MPSPLSHRPDKTFLVQAGTERLRIDLRRGAGGFATAQVLRGVGAAPGARDADTPPRGADPFLGNEGRESVDTDGLVALLSRRPRPAREITVLSDRLTAVVTDIPGLGGESWQSSAEMEAQTVSGLATSEALSAATRLSSDAGVIRAWVVQAPIRDFTALRAAVNRSARGGRLVAVGHPAGIRIASPAAQLELWPEFSLFHAPGGDRIELQGWNGPFAAADALADANVTTALVATAPQTDLLLAISEADGVEKDARRLDLADEKAAATWADALAQACDPLSGRILGMPLVAVPKPPPSTGLLVASAAGCAALIGLVLGAHFLFTRMNRDRLTDDLSRLKAPAEKLAADQNRISELQKEQEELGVTEDADGETTEIDFFAHRKRIGALLDGVAAGAAVNGAVVLEITSEGLDPIVKGVASTFNAPQDLAGQIDKALATRGWRATLIRRTAKLLRRDGGPWTYEIRLTPGRPVIATSSLLGDQMNGPNSIAKTKPSTTARLSGNH